LTNDQGTDWLTFVQVQLSVDRYYDPGTGQFLSVDPLVDETGQPYAYTGDDPVNEVDPGGLAPQAPELSEAEQQAIQNKEDGLPYNKQDYNSAQRKIQQAEKYGGTRNVQKRTSNFDWNPLPALGSALSSAGTAIWHGLQSGAKPLVEIGGAIAAGLAWFWGEAPAAAATTNTC
jgi:RHS repeat-associated protein